MDPASNDILLYIIIGAVALLAMLFFWIARKNRRMPGDHVFRASRLTKGNRIFPAQVAISPTSLTLRHAQWIGKLEESVHIAHISSIQIDTSLLFSDVSIETTGGHNPLVCHGHTKGDAIRMKAIIEEIQSAHYRKRTHEDAR